MKMLISLLILLLFMVPALADEDLRYNKNSCPVFEFLDSPLIYTMRGSYQINNTTISGNISNYRDSNIKLDYLLKGRKVAPGIKIKFGPTEHYNESTKQVEVIPYTGSDEWTELHFETELSSINSYLNKPSIQADFSVNYDIFNSEVEYLTPFIFELGEWPQYIGGKNIENLLDNPVKEDFLLIYGTEKVLIFYKDSKSFYYKITRKDNQYFLEIEKKVDEVSNGSLNIFFRPFRIKHQIKNLDILPPANIYSSLRLRPELVFEISNKDINQLNFSYLIDSNKTTKNKELESDGTIKFDELVDLDGNKIMYPFDSYIAKINVEPPLLISEVKEIDMPAGCEFEGKLKIAQNNIEISIERSTKERFKYIISLISFIIILVLSIIYNKPFLWYIEFFIGAYFVWYVVSNIGYLISFGSITSLVVLVISALYIIYKAIPIK